jgi:hypothetical protein
MRALRISLRASHGASDDIPSDVLRAILDANDREASQRTMSLQSVDENGHNNTSSTQRQRRRRWDACQTAPSRPGIIRIDTHGAAPNIGQVDEAFIYTRRVDAVHSIQTALHERLGRSIDRTEYTDMQRVEEEGEEQLTALQVLRPSVMEWAVPPDPQIVKREKFLPPPSEEVLALPDSLLAIDTEHELCRGIVVTVGDENGREESWKDVSVDQTPLCENEMIVQCYKCRSGLKVHVNTGLVICPRCRNISPASDVITIGRVR